MASTTPAQTADQPRVTPIATIDMTVLDTPEPRVLADFYGALLGWQIVDEEADWVAIEGPGGRLGFQLAPDLIPPSWPDGSIPQQIHLDVTVPELDVAEAQVLAIGARLTGEPKQPTSFRVYLDPSGHPFCLCQQKG